MRERVAKFPRWQTAVSRAVSSQVARTGALPPRTSRSLQYWVARLLGQPLSPARWGSMTFNDKVIYTMLRVEDPCLSTYNDKLRMRSLVAEQLGEEALPRLVRQGATAAEFADLVGPLALKANHGSGWNIFVTEERPLSAAELERADWWTTQNFGATRREWGYEDARPLLFAEELLSDPLPVDYKFFTFNGETKAILVCFDRAVGLRRIFMTPAWRPLGGMQEPAPEVLPERPANLDTMLDWATTLAQGTDFLRVDFYDLDDRVLVGELTPYPLAGRQRFNPDSLDALFGAWWTAPPRSSR